MVFGLEAAACGVPVLSDWFDGLDAFFEPGDEEILVARSVEEAMEAIASPREERAWIARRAGQPRRTCGIIPAARAGRPSTRAAPRAQAPLAAEASRVDMLRSAGFAPSPIAGSEVYLCRLAEPDPLGGPLYPARPARTGEEGRP